MWSSPQENMQRAERALAETLGCGEDNASYNQEKCSVTDISGDVPVTKTSLPQTPSKVVSGDAGRVDLIVLPEMFTTGFCFDPSHAEGVIDDGAETVAWMRRMAERYDAAVTGSVAVADGERYFNRMYFVRPDGCVEYYDKRHLFAMGGEADHYTAGHRRVVVGWRGVRILLQVCYDLRFPVFARSRGDYDMIVYAANWPTPRIAVWDTLLRARAIENQCYVVGVNRTGDDPWNHYAGDSAVVDFKGTPLCEADASEGVFTARLDREALDRFRTKFPAWRDADDFLLR